MTTPIHPETRIGHVHLKVADLERAIGFYSGVLGFELQQRYGAVFLLALIGLSGTALPLPPDARYLGALVYLALFGSVIGFTTYLMLVARMGSGRAAYATVMFPVIALMLSWAFEGYHWQLTALAGVGLTLLGNVILFARAPLRAPRPATPANRAVR